jgi:poly-gamma-glutamate capsule biosynthesis protein CapA/YwtB (metallophosphatase superfamily)
MVEPDGTRSPRKLWQLAGLLAVATVVAWAVQVRTPDDRLVSLSTGDQVDAGAPAPSAQTFTIAVSGEILPHPSVVEHARIAGQASGRPYDFAPMFAALEPLLGGADLAICHLEVPVAPPGSALSGYPNFGIPADIAAGIHAGGWDRCSTVSNHTNDRGTPGIVATLDALDAAQVGHSGSARTPDEGTAIAMVQVSGVQVAHLAYTWGFNGTPPAAPWMAHVIDPARILADARRAREQGAELVVVSMHWGDEYDTTGNAQQRALSDQLLASPDVDLIVGHGPHVIQPVETFHGKYSLLSVGNLVANQGKERPATYDGMVATITFTRGADGRFTAAAPVVHPTWYDRAAGVVRLVQPSLADPLLASQHPALQASLDRTTAVVGANVAHA